MNRFLWPLLIFIVLVAFMAVGIERTPPELASPLIGQAAPVFLLPVLDAAPKGESSKVFSPNEMLGKVWMLNVWASWCVSCRAEHSLLVEMKDKFPLIGLNYKEVRGDAANAYAKPAPWAERELARERASAWLKRNGDPYALSVLDTDGRVGIDYGVYGVPETFVIDKNGVIRAKHIGPITRDALVEKLLPLIAELSR
ncbi:MAG: DsbE family thiol:disulfide interchange protein [Candidatus Accumulibacter sp.]|jgi:cytochrome c biogenesis protein CcmG/thiol:disulfide interchange protein DsbE|nr:DsbE family thiol:disulfide interchange protein [Accumulibacter sp.]